jgi:S-formylglutathione hydrolase FrmB
VNRACSVILQALVLCCLGAAIGSPLRATARADCRSISSKILSRDVSYCVFLPPGYDEDASRHYPVLYFLHGLGENDQILINAGGWNLIQDLWEQKQIGDFIVIAPSAGRSFYLNSRDGRVRYEDFFIREFIPFAESHYRIEAAKRARGIMGISMGGYGALHLAFRYPQEFGSVSVHSAALVAKLPEIKDPDLPDNPLAGMVGAAFGSPFDRDFWNRNNPFTIVRNNPPPAGLRVYLDCGTEDQFGFDLGAQAFHDLLDSKGIANEFHLYPGGHDWVYFAEHFPASLQFESRAFGLYPRGK